MDLAHVDERVHRLRQQVTLAESRLAALRAELHQAEAEAASRAASSQQWPLPPDDYRRYARQLIMPEVGLPGQLKLKASKVLIVGVGGLGCPAAAYLAGAGVGTLGLMDGDTVQLSNLHRQVLHSTSRIDQYKVHSAIAHLAVLNPTINLVAHTSFLAPDAALDTFARYDLVLDCTDHPTSRYLISDACVLSGKPLVSASALKTEGQLIVLNNPPRPPGDPAGGPCYRCVWPTPPPPETVTSCGEGGVLGPVVGVMGVLQALEAIKLITATSPPPTPTLLIFSAYAHPQQFRSVRMRARRPDCAACSASATVTPATLTSGSTDYVAFCGVARPISILSPSERLTAAQLAAAISEPSPVRPAILDVRSAAEHALCALDGSVNVPWPELGAALDPADSPPCWLQGRDLVVVCRLGNDSQLAVEMLRGAGLAGDRRVVDLAGGLRAWREDVDPSWPDY